MKRIQNKRKQNKNKKRNKTIKAKQNDQSKTKNPKDAAWCAKQKSAKQNKNR